MSSLLERLGPIFAVLPSAERFRKLAENPLAYSWVLESAIARVRGEWYRHSYRLRSGGRVRIGKGFVAECALRISGPGTVQIGDRCRIRRSNLQDVAILTLSRDARVDIGEDSTMGGLRVRCAERVEIGRLLLAAKTTVTDTDYGMANAERPAGRGVVIGPDCWLGVETMICGGVKLGKNVVVSGGSVVLRDMPDDTMAMGNPARPVKIPGGKPK
jgi:acetyltransferase-like isoleucine patch superfamily enzyme